MELGKALLNGIGGACSAGPAIAKNVFVLFSNIVSRSAATIASMSRRRLRWSLLFIRLICCCPGISPLCGGRRSVQGVVAATTTAVSSSINYSYTNSSCTRKRISIQSLTLVCRGKNGTMSSKVCRPGDVMALNGKFYLHTNLPYYSAASEQYSKYQVEVAVCSRHWLYTSMHCEYKATFLSDICSDAHLIKTFS